MLMYAICGKAGMIEFLQLCCCQLQLLPPSITVRRILLLFWRMLWVSLVTLAEIVVQCGKEVVLFLWDPKVFKVLDRCSLMACRLCLCVKTAELFDFFLVRNILLLSSVCWLLSACCSSYHQTINVHRASLFHKLECVYKLYIVQEGIFFWGDGVANFALAF